MDDKNPVQKVADMLSEAVQELKKHRKAQTKPGDIVTLPKSGDRYRVGPRGN